VSTPLDDPAFDALALAELVRRREVTPAELLDAALAKMDAENPKLNAVVRRMEGEARSAIAAGLPEGAFTGVPFLLKDLMAECAGVPLTCGSRFLSGWVPDRDGELVRRYRRAGLVIAGKTNTPELGITPVTEPVLFGPARNPWDRSLTAGGSSGGSAAAVAAGIVPMAHGGDGGGSIRIPAACCGLFGLKPTRGRTPLGPSVGEAWQGLVVEHVLSRSVRDSAAALDATAGPDAGAPTVPPPPSRPYLPEVSAPPGRLRIAVTTTPFLGSSVAPVCLEAVSATAKLLRELGHEVDEAAPPVDRASFSLAFVTVLAAETSSEVEEAARRLGRRPATNELEESTWALALLGRALSAEALATALRTLRLAARGIGEFFGAWDLLLTPTLSRPPVPHGALQLSPGEKALTRALVPFRAGRLMKLGGVLEKAAERTFDFIPYTPVFNVTGQPAMSMPLFETVEGLPVGLHFVGRFGDEATLFRLAGQLERARPWAGRRPWDAGVDFRREAGQADPTR